MPPPADSFFEGRSKAAIIICQENPAAENGCTDTSASGAIEKRFSRKNNQGQAPKSDQGARLRVPDAPVFLTHLRRV
jgi:hypothetical protein